MKPIAITGATGFLGTNLVNYFNKSDDVQLFVHSRDTAKAKLAFQSYRIEFLENPSSAKLNESKIDIVIHLAGIAHDLSNRYKPQDYYRVNFEDTKSIYDEFSKSGATKFIFLSSMKAAVDISSMPVDESVNPNPVTDYGKSKLLAEQYITDHPIPGKQFYILRPCMIHGSGNKGNLNLFYRFVKSGWPYPLGCFENRRSFLSVDNFTFVIRKIIEERMPSGIYHLADDGCLSSKELYELISDALGKKPLVLNIPKRIIQFGAGVVGKIQPLNKLTEDMMVSNEKLLRNLNCQLPVLLQEGLIKTIRSFGE